MTGSCLVVANMVFPAGEECLQFFARIKGVDESLISSLGGFSCALMLGAVEGMGEGGLVRHWQ